MTVGIIMFASSQSDGTAQPAPKLLTQKDENDDSSLTNLAWSDQLLRSVALRLSRLAANTHCLHDYFCGALLTFA